jgi:hypothetical protein
MEAINIEMMSLMYSLLDWGNNPLIIHSQETVQNTKLSALYHNELTGFHSTHKELDSGRSMHS